MNSDIDGRDRYDVCGIQAEDVIAEVMERLAPETDGMAPVWDVANALKYLLRIGGKDQWTVEAGKAENYLHHARTGEWIGDHARTREWIKEENDDED